MQAEAVDPKGLIRESYRIDGITTAECRSVFLDWALSLPEGANPQQAISELLLIYGGWTDHPMTGVLREGATPTPAAGRRGGRAARLSNGD